MAGIIDGREWLRERIDHLEVMLSDDLLTDGLGTDQRDAVEAELARLREELGRSRRRRRWSFLLGGGGDGR